MNMRHALPDKIRVARSFGKAAGSYDRYAHVQRDIARKLLDPIGPGCADRVLDLGSGTGFCASQLVDRIPAAEIVSLDIAETMLHYASAQGNRDREAWVCGDAEALPFTGDTFDMVVSNLAMQWCPGINCLLDELFRVLKPGGHAYISTLAEFTLAELRSSWANSARVLI